MSSRHDKYDDLEQVLLFEIMSILGIYVEQLFNNLH